MVLTVADRRLHGHLIRVQLHGRVARPCNVGRVRRDDGVLAQEPRDHLVDDWVVEQVQEVIPLVDQSPEPLVGALGAAVHLRDARLALACGLFLHGLLHDGALFGRQDVLDNPVPELLDISLDLLDVLSRLWQPGECVSMLRRHRRARRQQIGKLDSHGDAARGHGRLVEESIFEKPVSWLKLAVVELCNVLRLDV